jgi:hypothetical protein
MQRFPVSSSGAAVAEPIGRISIFSNCHLKREYQSFFRKQLQFKAINACSSRRRNLASSTPLHAEALGAEAFQPSARLLSVLAKIDLLNSSDPRSLQVGVTLVCKTFSQMI